MFKIILEGGPSDGESFELYDLIPDFYTSVFCEKMTRGRALYRLTDDIKKKPIILVIYRFDIILCD